MTVAELIAELQKLPPDLEVLSVDGDCCSCCVTEDVRVIRDPADSRDVQIVGYRP